MLTASQRSASFPDYTRHVLAVIAQSRAVHGCARTAFVKRGTLSRIPRWMTSALSYIKARIISFASSNPFYFPATLTFSSSAASSQIPVCRERHERLKVYMVPRTQ